MIQFSKTERIASVICGILLFILAAFLSTAIVLNIINYIPEGSLKILWDTGSTLMNSYGFSSILIPGFLMVAGAFCFDSQWTVQRAMGLLISIIPFFTIVVAEKIARKTVAFDTYTLMLVKLILLGVITTLLVLTEYLVAMIVASAIQKRTAAKKNPDQNQGDNTESEKTQTAKKGFTLFASIKNSFAKTKTNAEIDDIDLMVEDNSYDQTQMEAALDGNAEIDEDELEEEIAEEPEQNETEEEIPLGDQEKTVAIQRETPQPRTEKTKTDTEFNEPKIAENFFSNQEAKPVEVPHSTDELLKDTEDDAFNEPERQSVGETISSLWSSTKNKFKDLMEFGKKREAEQEEERLRRKEEARRSKEDVDIDDYFEEAAPVLPKIDAGEEKERLYSDKRDNIRKDAFITEHQREDDRSFIREETFDLEQELSPKEDRDNPEDCAEDIEDIIRQFETENKELNETELEPSYPDIQEEDEDYPEEEIETQEIDIEAFSGPKTKKVFGATEDNIVFDDESETQTQDPEPKHVYYSEEVIRRHEREEAEAIEKKRKEMQAQSKLQRDAAERKIVDIESPLSRTSQSQYTPAPEPRVEIQETKEEPAEQPRFDDFQFENDEPEKKQKHGLFQRALSVSDTQYDDQGEDEEEDISQYEEEPQYSTADRLPDIQVEDDDYSEYEDEQDEVQDDFSVQEEEVQYKPTYEEKPKRRVPTGPYSIPTSLLTAYEDNPYWVIDEETKAAAQNLKETLAEFKIEAEITGIQKGPVVTMFEILPAPGVKLNRIVALQDNIALRLAASSVRIVAPIPGKHAVGIEVPNKERAIISIRECLEQNRSEWTKMGVPVVLGKDIQGNTQIIDLVKTPHLLIAGATGAGKSVCVNSMILSILYKRSPRDVKMILIDPKIVELKLYNDIPHLLTPVITEPKRAMQALQYCLCEMERRYALLDGMSVRDITSYNRKIVEKKIATEHLPYLIVVIDEFADLMATTGKQLEGVLARLAAMSRAVGIHLVLATQRPSIDVITGLIKANIPSRIAFMVASKTDSRIILDQMGADKLLGKGDMLYTSATDPFPIRIQGTFVSDGEVENVVNAVKEWGEPEYIDDEIFVDDDEDGDEGQMSLFNPETGDPLFEKALDIVVQAGKASASYIQRRLKIGYNRAARLVEEMEERGIVGPANGSKPREIIHMP